MPGLVCELAATLFLQLLQDAAVYDQAGVDFCKELFYVHVERAQDVVTDLCELRNEGGSSLSADWAVLGGDGGTCLLGF